MRFELTYVAETEEDRLFMLVKSSPRSMDDLIRSFGLPLEKTTITFVISRAAMERMVGQAPLSLAE